VWTYKTSFSATKSSHVFSSLWYDWRGGFSFHSKENCCTKKKCDSARIGLHLKVKCSMKDVASVDEIRIIEKKLLLFVVAVCCCWVLFVVCCWVFFVVLFVLVVVFCCCFLLSLLLSVVVCCCCILLLLMVVVKLSFAARRVRSTEGKEHLDGMALILSSLRDISFVKSWDDVYSNVIHVVK